MLIISTSARAQDNLIISEVTDPADDYSGRFIELYNAGSEAVDFSTLTFYLSRQSNGGTSWGDVQLAGSLAAGETYVIGGSGFESLYGFAPDLLTGILIGNGDDAYCLFRDGDHSAGILQDIFGAIGIDGTGESWEYEDSRAVRVEGVTVPNTTWTAAEWEIASADIGDCDPGTHHGSEGNDTIPPGDYAISILSDTVNTGQPVEVHISVSELTVEDNIIAYQFDIDYDSLVLEYTGISVAGTIAEGGTVVANASVAGKLSVGYINTTAITGTGDILILQFNSQVIDTTDLYISNAYLNNTPVQYLTHGTITIAEIAPPTAVITYNDSINRFADTLMITATFSELMDPGIPVRLSLSGVVNLADADMARLNDTVYYYLFPIPKADGEVTIRLSNGTDLWGNEVVSVPTSGDTFTITAFTPGDVNDDGVIQAYDAALTLQYSVGIDPLPAIDPMPWENWRDSTANVDGTGGITANDAALILQYSTGIISGFSGEGMKSVFLANVTVEVVGHHIVFYSYGELLGLNISTTNENGILGAPEVLAEEFTLLNPTGFMSAFNINGTVYNIGLCTAQSPPDGSAVMKIPFHGGGSVSFDMIVNTDEDRLTIDLPTGLVESPHEELTIFPNPATERLNISGLSGQAEARIYNIHGQLMITALAGAPAGEINVSDLPAGFYMIMLETNKETVVRRFSKK